MIPTVRCALGMAFALAVVAFPAAAQQSTLAADAAAFGAREGAWAANLSPSGRLVAYMAPAPNGSTVAFVSDLDTGQSKSFLSSGGGPERISWCRFVTDARLVCRYEATLVEEGYLVSYSRLVAINRDGSNPKQLGQPSSFYDEGRRQFDGEIIDWLPGGDGSVLMSRTNVAEINRTGTRLSRNKSGLGVDRIDTSTLKSTAVEAPRRAVSRYVSDGRGQVRLMELVEQDGIGVLSGRVRYQYRTSGSKDWKDLTPYQDYDAFQPMAIDATTDHLYFLRPLQGRKALYRMKLDGSGATELVASNNRVDIDEVIRSGNGQHVIGYGFAEDKREAVYFDPEYKRLATSLGRAIPQLPLIDFLNSSANESSILLFAGSDSDPGRYYVFNKPAKKLEELFSVRPALSGRTLANVRSVTVQSSDGVAIPAYLTVPPGKEAKNLPAVVLPHGGPSARDEWGFDWLAQFLAARGYAVLQPNYRGSAGFGDAWLVENGFRSWRVSIGDIIASGRWLSAQGIADPQRIAVVGWSYGGYAALQAAVTDPAAFKAVAAIAPVTDLALMKKDAAAYSNSKIVADFIGSGPHLAEGSPLRRAAAIKVPVLLAHGAMDTNVAIGHSEKMADALREAGTPVEFLRYPKLDHQLDDSAVRREVLTKIGSLLERTIGAN